MEDQPTKLKVHSLGLNLNMKVLQIFCKKVYIVIIIRNHVFSSWKELNF